MCSSILTLINSYQDIKRLKKNIFLGFRIPNGRGDISKIKSKNRKFFLVDETYNSNPLSLKTAIENYDEIQIKESKKYLILGDMLELGKIEKDEHEKLGINLVKKLKDLK